MTRKAGWTDDEKALLLSCRYAKPPLSWEDIQRDIFPNRTEEGLRQQWYKLQREMRGVTAKKRLRLPADKPERPLKRRRVVYDTQDEYEETDEDESCSLEDEAGDTDYEMGAETDSRYDTESDDDAGDIGEDGMVQLFNRDLVPDTRSVYGQTQQYSTTLNAIGQPSSAPAGDPRLFAAPIEQHRSQISNNFLKPPTFAPIQNSTARMSTNPGVGSGFPYHRMRSQASSLFSSGQTSIAGSVPQWGQYFTSHSRPTPTMVVPPPVPTGDLLGKVTVYRPAVPESRISQARINIWAPESINGATQGPGIQNGTVSPYLSSTWPNPRVSKTIPPHPGHCTVENPLFRRVEPTASLAAGQNGSAVSSQTFRSELVLEGPRRDPRPMTSEAMNGPPSSLPQMQTPRVKKEPMSPVRSAGVMKAAPLAAGRLNQLIITNPSRPRGNGLQEVPDAEPPEAQAIIRTEQSYENIYRSPNLLDLVSQAHHEATIQHSNVKGRIEMLRDDIKMAEDHASELLKCRTEIEDLRK